MPMRILSRFWTTLRRSHDALPGALAVGIVLASSAASAQPAAPPPKPPAAPAARPPAPRPPPAKAPPKAPPPAQGDAAGDAAGAAAAAPGDAPAAPPAQPAPGAGQPPAQPAPAQPPPKEEPLLPPGDAAAAQPGAAQGPPAAPGQGGAAAPDPDKDAKALAKQGGERPSSEIGARPSDVYAEDWWSTARPVFEIHGYYRVRAELFHNFALGRRDVANALWPQPVDNSFVPALENATPNAVNLCGDTPLTKAPCQSNTQAGANMRFRLNPELHISDNLRVLSQIDLLDNVILGSTPEGYYNVPGTSGGYTVGARGGYTPTGAFTTTQWVPTAGVNSTTNSISVKRVWGEYMTPVGLLRFGRMPSHWGLGMLANAGDGHDSDWQSTADRIMLVTGIKKWDLYFAGAWEFANEGATSASFNQQGGQPYDLGQYDDVSQYVFAAVRRRNPEMQRLELAKGQVVVNGGVYFVYRSQFLANDNSGSGSGTSGNANTPSIGAGGTTVSSGYFRRNAKAYIPDFWLQFLYRKFRFEAEGAMIYGSLDSLEPFSAGYVNPTDKNNPGWKIRQFGFVTQSEFRALEDKLRIQFGFGWASGDPDLDSLAPPANGFQPQRTNDRTISEFRFHPDYRVDLILFRNILTRVQGAYYFRPSVDYDFTRDKNGQRLGGGAALIWSRASEFIQTSGHARDLGVELNFQLYYQSKDGALNDDPDRMGGFFTSLQYGVMFPLAGFNYLPGEIANANKGTIKAGFDAYNPTLDTSTAQTLRWYMGILF
jgi:uncharacterized protein (TIGR04551 family)